jgi:hypothetical protein
MSNKALRERGDDEEHYNQQRFICASDLPCSRGSSPEFEARPETIRRRLTYDGYRTAKSIENERPRLRASVVRGMTMFNIIGINASTGRSPEIKAYDEGEK